MPYDTLIPLIAILPLAGFVFTALFGRRLQAQYGKAAASAVPPAGGCTHRSCCMPPTDAATVSLTVGAAPTGPSAAPSR